MRISDWSSDVCSSDLLDRRFRRLGRLDHADDLGEHRVAADLGGAEPEGAGLVDGGSDDGVAGLLGDGDRFAGDHGLVDRRAAIDDLAVDGALLAGADDDDIAAGHIFDGDLDLGTIANDTCRAVLEADQLADGLTGAGLGPSLQKPADQELGKAYVRARVSN